jgi:hypothetical protein
VKIKKGKGRLSATCNAPTGVVCHATGQVVVNGKHPRVIGTVSGNLRGGSRGPLAVKLNKLGRKLLARRRSLAAALTGSFSDSAGGRGSFGGGLHLVRATP